MDIENKHTTKNIPDNEKTPGVEVLHEIILAKTKHYKSRSKKL